MNVTEVISCNNWNWPPPTSYQHWTVGCQSPAFLATGDFVFEDTSLRSGLIFSLGAWEHSRTAVFWDSWGSIPSLATLSDYPTTVFYISKWCGWLAYYLAPPSATTLATERLLSKAFRWRLRTLHSGQRGEQLMQTQGSHVYTASREDEIIHNCNIERRMFRHQ